MGICTSCYSDSTATATATTTVKLILLDGQLREFSYPVKVMVIQTLNSFICNADNMDFNDYVRAMHKEDVLRPGQLYFELPLNWLNKRLAAQDMASLAVKAGAALMVNGGGGKVGCGCWAKRADPVVFYDDDSGGSRRRGGGDKGRLFTRLERIVE